MICAMFRFFVVIRRAGWTYSRGTGYASFVPQGLGSGSQTAWVAALIYEQAMAGSYCGSWARVVSS